MCKKEVQGTIAKQNAAPRGCEWCAHTARLCANTIKAITVSRTHLYNNPSHTKEVCFSPFERSGSFFVVSWGGVRPRPLRASTTIWPIVAAPIDNIVLVILVEYYLYNHYY
jgi:hypothetical protein